MSRKPEMRDLIKSLVDKIEPGGCVEASTIVDVVKHAGFNHGNISRIMREFGFVCDRAGQINTWHRKYKPNDYMPQADENGHVPSVLERLQAQVANGERQMPAANVERQIPAASVERTAPVVHTAVDGNTAVTRTEPSRTEPSIEKPARTEPSIGHYRFESVVTAKTLLGSYGQYTVRSDGSVVMEHLLPGTMAGKDQFLGLIQELCAVKAVLDEMEAMSK